jgi:hypothetical protein
MVPFKPLTWLFLTACKTPRVVTLKIINSQPFQPSHERPEAFRERVYRWFCPEEGLPLD